MSNSPLYPEDVLNYKPTLRDRALLAKEEAAAREEAEKTARNEETKRELAAAIWDFMTEDMECPSEDLATKEFRTVMSGDLMRLEWEIEGIQMRAEFYVINGSRRPKFEVKSGVAQFGQAWKQFHDLVSLGRLID